MSGIMLMTSLWALEFADSSATKSTQLEKGNKTKIIITNNLYNKPFLRPPTWSIFGQLH